MIPSLSSALTDKRLSPWDFQLLFLLVLTELDMLEFRELKVAAVAKQLDRDEESVARSLLQLTRTGYLDCEPRPRPGAMAKYRLRYRIVIVHPGQTGVSKAVEAAE